MKKIDLQQLKEFVISKIKFLEDEYEHYLYVEKQSKEWCDIMIQSDINNYKEILKYLK